MRRVALLLMLLLPCGCGPRAPWESAPPVAMDLRAELSAAEAPLLQPVDLVLDLFVRRDLDVAFDPAVPDGLQGSVELLPVRELGHGFWHRAVLHVRPVKGPGTLSIPAFEVNSRDGTVTARTEPLELAVTTLLQDAAADLEVPGPLLMPPQPLWPWLAGAGGVALLVALGWWWRRMSRRPRPHPVAIAVPPHTKALRELQRLRGVPRRLPAEVDAFYVATSQVLRVYLEERFGLRAPERTTEEFLAEIESGGPLSAAQCLEVRRFLQQCDLVKFAAQTPNDEQHLQTLAIAEQLVEATRADRVPMGVGA